MLFVFNPHRIYGNGLSSGFSGKMLATGCLVRHDGGGDVSCPLGLRTEEGQGAGCGFHLSFHRIYRQQARNLGSKRLGGSPGSSVVKKSACQCRRRGFNPWVRKTPLEKGMATHSSILAWRTAWTEDPGGLQSMGSQRGGQD